MPNTSCEAKEAGKRREEFSEGLHFPARVMPMK